MSPPLLAIDPSLRERFVAAGAKIVWREAPTRPPGARIAHLHDEEARLERRRTDRSEEIWVDAGPVGALLLLLAMDEAERAPVLAAIDPPDAPGFPAGALVARWGGPPEGPGAPRIADLVALARYALA